MPRPRRSESFSVRWHSLANPATPSADIMSSPDPLNDATDQLLPAPPSSSRRGTRSSLRSQRFASVAASPRKQMFELQVDDNRSPQKLWVTVETDAAAAAARPSRGTSRKLFQSPAAMPVAARRLRDRAVTTTVPLQASIEEDEPGPAATPKRRGRPRKTNGTPMPSAAKRKAAAPADERSPRRPRLAETSREPDAAPSQDSVQPTPGSARRGRPPRNRSAPEPSLKPDAEATPRASPTKRQRRTKQAAVPEELEELAAEPPAHDEPRSATASEDGMDLVGAPEQVSSALPPPDAAPVDDDGDSDIWMATMSNEEATPRATAPPSPSPSHRAPGDALPLSEHGGGASAVGDYIDFAPAASDTSSIDELVAPRRSDDTIAQGEDFSMIFMDSIPSLQGVSKGSIPPAAHEELSEETSLIINNTLQYLRQEGGAQDAEADAPPPAEPTPAQAMPRPDQDELASSEPTPTRATASISQSRGPSPRWSRTPRKAADSSPLRHRVLRHTARQAEETAAADAAKNSEDPLTTSQRTESGGFNDEASHAYEDSFSEIPQEILISATPGHPNTVRPDGGGGDEHEEGKGQEQEGEDEERADLLQGDGFLRREDENEAARDEPAPASSSSASSVSRSEAGRLPTPDDTPPQPEYQDAEQAKSDGASGTSSKPASAPAELEGLGASVTGPSLEVADPSMHPVEETPFRKISSPLQEPQSVQQKAWHDKTARPGLSAIVRAGRALQSITLDQPSPEGREKQLGSPFRSSGSNGSLNSQTSRRMSKSPQQPRAFAEARAPPVSPGKEDPFAAASQNTTGQSRFMQALGVRVPEEQAPSPVRGSPGSSMRFTPNSDGVMSWVAKEGPISPRLMGDNSLQQAARRSFGAAAVESPGQLGEAAADRGSVAERDDETDIWEFEAQREMPRVTRQQPFGKRSGPWGHRRSVASGNWAGGTVGGLTSPATKANAAGEQAEKKQSPTGSQASEADEYSLVAQRRQQQQQRQGEPARGAESASKADRFDLSSFFSSPTAIPGMLAHKLLPAKASTAMFGAATTPVAPVMPTSCMFPPVPPSGAPSSSSAAAARWREAGEGVEGHGSASPERQPLREQSVAPRRSSRQSSRRATPQQQGSAATTPPRMQLSHADIHRWQQETSHAAAAAHPPRSPPKNASPKKSSLRSPLKPRTPGRVVDFTSSVLSPAEQARARHERRLSIASAPSIASLARPRVAFAPPPPQPPQPAVGSDDKETSDDVEDVSIADAPPLDEQQETEHEVERERDEDTPEPPLSQTVWTRRHWLLLDELLQLRRRAPFAPAPGHQQPHASALGYLGKTVKSQGEAIRLERWHLDVVDAFRAAVGGWNEGVLAKRLFSLILGEERRRRARLGRPSRIMFH